MESNRARIAICDNCHQVVTALQITPHEWKVLKRIINGESNREVAEALFISIRTVEAHVQNIQHKTDTSNIAQLIKWANDQGLLDKIGWK